MVLSATSVNRTLKRYALSFPEAWEDHPWGGTVAKVRKKIFCSLASGPDQKEWVVLSVKLPHSEAQALDWDGAQPTHYGLGQHGWVTLKLDPVQMPSVDVLKGYIEESYRAIAPKTLVRMLDASGD